MKKGFFLMMLLAGGMGVMAQVDSMTATTTTTSTTSMNNTTDNNSIMLLSTGDYSAYSAPANVQLYFNRDYPTVSSTVNWMPVGEYWRATYNNNGRYSHVFYTSNGDHYLVNLPVTSSYVPDDIITTSANAHPGTVYDVTTLKAWDGSNVYQVRYIDNGTITTEMIDDNGNAVTEYWRTEEMQKKMDDLRMNKMNMSSDVPESVRTSFSRDYPNVTVYTWNPSANVTFDRSLAEWPAASGNEYLVTFNQDNHDYYTWYDMNGNQIGSTYTISDYSTLPSGISTSINTNFPDYTIHSANWLSRNGTASYQLTLQGQNNKQVRVILDENGNVIRQQ